MKKETFNLLKSKVAEQGQSQVARDLGVSQTTVALVLKGTYAASTANIGKKIMAAYGLIGIECPELGKIRPDVCAENYRRWKLLGLRAGNPATVRLRAACSKCEARI